MEILFGLLKLPFLLIAWTIGLVMLAFVLFSIAMLVDCLKRPASEFGGIIFQDPQYEKLAWIIVIIFTAKLFAVGAFAYLFMVKGRKMGPIEEDA